MSIKCALTFHEWSGCKCMRCGMPKKSPVHSWRGSTCAICGKNGTFISDALAAAFSGNCFQPPTGIPKARVLEEIIARATLLHASMARRSNSEEKGLVLRSCAVNLARLNISRATVDEQREALSGLDRLYEARLRENSLEGRKSLNQAERVRLLAAEFYGCSNLAFEVFQNSANYSAHFGRVPDLLAIPVFLSYRMYPQLFDTKLSPEFFDQQSQKQRAFLELITAEVDSKFQEAIFDPTRRATLTRSTILDDSDQDVAFRMHDKVSGEALLGQVWSGLMSWHIAIDKSTESIVQADTSGELIWSAGGKSDEGRQPDGEGTAANEHTRRSGLEQDEALLREWQKRRGGSGMCDYCNCEVGAMEGYLVGRTAGTLICQSCFRKALPSLRADPKYFG